MVQLRCCEVLSVKYLTVFYHEWTITSIGPLSMVGLNQDEMLNSRTIKFWGHTWNQWMEWLDGDHLWKAILSSDLIRWSQTQKISQKNHWAQSNPRANHPGHSAKWGPEQSHGPLLVHRGPKRACGTRVFWIVGFTIEQNTSFYF